MNIQDSTTNVDPSSDDALFLPPPPDRREGGQKEGCSLFIGESRNQWYGGVTKCDF